MISTRGQKRKRQGEVIDEAIAFANVTKDASTSLSVLTPLKTVMEILITLLKNVQVSQVS
jgi:hypothetical protein